MSDIQLKSEIEGLIKKSGYKETHELQSTIIRIITMKYRDMPREQVLRTIKSMF